MKFRSYVIAAGIILFSVGAFLVGSADRVPWVITSFLCFGGIFLFDQYSQISNQWMNTVVFLLIYGLTLGAILAGTPDVFWRDFAGAIFLVSILFEQNALPWAGFGPLRTTVTPALVFLLLVFAQNIPYLPSETVYTFSLAALIISSYMELFCIFRENTAMNAGSFMAALRVACVGVGSLFYSAVFLPGIARLAPFNFMYIGLPALAICVSVFAILLKHWRRRQILFYCNWSVFIFWSALTGESARFFAAVGALIAAVITIMMTDRSKVQSQDPKNIYLKLSAWGVPGSFLFTMIAFSLVPSSDELIRRGSALWVISFFIFWSGLRSFNFSPQKVAENLPWTWRNRLALGVTLFGAGALAGGKILTEILFEVWPQGWGLK